MDKEITLKWFYSFQNITFLKEICQNFNQFLREAEVEWQHYSSNFFLLFHNCRFCRILMWCFVVSFHLHNDGHSEGPMRHKSWLKFWQISFKNVMFRQSALETILIEKILNSCQSQLSLELSIFQIQDKSQFIIMFALRIYFPNACLSDQ